MSLTEKMLGFIAAYRGNGVAAARAAGYDGNERSLATIASRLLAREDVQEALQHRQGTIEAQGPDAEIAGLDEQRRWLSGVMRDPAQLVDVRLRAQRQLAAITDGPPPVATSSTAPSPGSRVVLVLNGRGPVDPGEAS